MHSLLFICSLMKNNWNIKQQWWFIIFVSYRTFSCWWLYLLMLCNAMFQIWNSKHKLLASPSFLKRITCFISLQAFQRDRSFIRVHLHCYVPRLSHQRIWWGLWNMFLEYIARTDGTGISELMHSCRCCWKWGESLGFEHTGLTKKLDLFKRSLSLKTISAYNEIKSGRKK